MKKWLVAATMGLMMASGVGGVQAGDAEAGKAKFTTCMACHGPAGQGQAIFPPVAGKDVDYLVEKLTQYKAGEQVGPNSPMMTPHVTNLSEQDIADLAAYMNSL